MLKRPSKRVTLENAAHTLFTVFFSYPFLISYSLELYIFMAPENPVISFNVSFILVVGKLRCVALLGYYL